jgi:hypothetical protein
MKTGDLAIANEGLFSETNPICLILPSRYTGYSRVIHGIFMPKHHGRSMWAISIETIKCYTTVFK